MRKADRAVAVLALLVAGLTAGCETTWRRSSLHHVWVEGRELTVSWIRLQPDEVEVVVWEQTAFQGIETGAVRRLDRPMAVRAAETVVAQVCGRSFQTEPVPATFAEGRHALRYRCGDGR